MAETRGRRTRANVSAFVARTKYQGWLHGALERRGVDVAELARMTNADYSHVWRIARGDPDKYPNSRRPGYDLALAIGEALKDVPGSLAAADWETPALPADQEIVLESGATFYIRARTGDTAKPFVVTPQLAAMLEAFALTGSEAASAQAGKDALNCAPDEGAHGGGRSGGAVDDEEPAALAL